MWSLVHPFISSTSHDKYNISDVQKFSYLKNQLKIIAEQCIAGLPLTTGYYFQAVEILREIFGQTQKITNSYI
jgi:hypothetical protein